MKPNLSKDYTVKNTTQAMTEANLATTDLAIDLANDFRIIKTDCMIFLAKKGAEGIYKRVDAFPAIGDPSDNLERFSDEVAQELYSIRTANLDKLATKWEGLVC